MALDYQQVVETLARMQQQIDLLAEMQRLQSQRLDTLSKMIDSLHEMASYDGLAILVGALHSDNIVGAVNRLQERLDSIAEVNHLWEGN